MIDTHIHTPVQVAIQVGHELVSPSRNTEEGVPRLEHRPLYDRKKNEWEPFV